MNNKKLRNCIILSLLLAIEIVISYVETFIPIPIPGVKLGLANVITLFILYENKWYNAFVILIARILLVAIIRGTLLNVVFFMSLFGGILSFIIMFIFSRFKFLSTITVSVFGSVCHVLGQIFTAIIITKTMGIIYYLPIILLLSIITGIISGIICIFMRKRASDLLPKYGSELNNN